jgi:hypothetical protein
MIKSVLHSISIWVVLMPFLIGTINFRELNNDSRWIFFLVSVALVPQLLTAFIENDVQCSMLPTMFYTPIEFLVLFVVFIRNFNLNPYDCYCGFYL